MQAKDLETITKNIDKNSSKEKQIKNFSDILDSIDTLENKKKALWKEIYENALEDREKSKLMFNDAYISMQGGINEHMNIGAIMSKYIERMSKSNDQILKLAELISKEEEKSEAVSDDDIFSKIKGWFIMFIRSRCLIVVDSSYNSAQDILSELDSLDITSKIFSDSRQNILEILSLLPSQTIFSKKIKELSDDDDAYYVSIPFFSSHLKTPVKNGEHIWVYPHQTTEYSSIYINSYWLSRVHGLKISEDVNFTFNDRNYDALSQVKDFHTIKNKVKEKQARKKRMLESHKASISQSMLAPIANFNNIYTDLNLAESSYLDAKIKSLPNRAISKIKSSSDDLTLQGSNNTSIKLSTNDYAKGQYLKNNAKSGEITLTSGIGKYIQSNNFSIKGNFVDAEGDTINSTFTLDYCDEFSGKPLKLKHVNDKFEENLKMPQIYTIFKAPLKSISEGASNTLSDASKIIVSESSSLCNDTNKKYNLKFNLPNYENVFKKSELSSNILDQEKKFKINYFDVTPKSVYSSSKKPSIGIISSNIDIFSRSEGNINITKEYYSGLFKENLNSYIRMNNQGDIFIDANRIFIGSVKHERKKSDFKNGRGTIIRLGESNESQSLVLGEQLKEFLNEMLDVNREDMHLTKNLFNKVSKTISATNSKFVESIGNEINNFIDNTKVNQTKVASELAAVNPLPGAVASKAVLTIYGDVIALCNTIVNTINDFDKKRKDLEKSLNQKIIDSKLKRSEDLSVRLEKIETNIDKILSKLSKTS